MFPLAIVLLGMAVAATLLSMSGIPADERRMARLCGTNAFSGTDTFRVTLDTEWASPPWEAETTPVLPRQTC